jgi:hypothetical protein
MQSSFLLVHRITGLLDFFHRVVFLGVETRRFGNQICFRQQVKGPLENVNLNHWTTELSVFSPFT